MLNFYKFHKTFQKKINHPAIKISQPADLQQIAIQYFFSIK